MPRPKRIMTQAEEKYAIIRPILDGLPNEDPENGNLKADAIKTALALLAVHQKELAELETLLPQVMPDFAAKKLLEYVEPYKTLLPFVYVGKEPDPPYMTNEAFYRRRISDIDRIDYCAWQLMKPLLDLKEEEPLTVALPYLFELAGKQKILRPCRTEIGRLRSYWYQAVWQADVSVSEFDWFNPSPKFEKMLDLARFKLSEKGKSIAQAGTAFRWLTEGAQTDPAQISDDSDNWYNWLDIASDILSLSPTGKAGVIVKADALTNPKFSAERRFLTSQGCIEAVVLLPLNLYFQEKYAFLVLRPPQPAGEHKVWFSDVRSEPIARTGTEPLSPQTIETVLADLHNDENAVSCQRLCQNECNLYYHKNQYLVLDELTKDGDSITRGTMSSMKELDELLTNQETDYQFLRVQDIQYGYVKFPLPYLTDVPAQQRKYAVSNETVLLICRNNSEQTEHSRSVFRTAVLEKADTRGKTILINGNMYILRLDEQKIDPYFLQAYLESEEGQAKLAEISTSRRAFMIQLGIIDLKHFRIPFYPPEEQKKIGEAFRRNIQEIKNAQKRLHDRIDSSRRIFSQY